MFSLFTNPTSELYGRYTDDCISATSLTREALIYFVNSFHLALELTSDNYNFSISIENSYLTTSIFYKPTGSHSYLDLSTHLFLA